MDLGWLWVFIIAAPILGLLGWLVPLALGWLAVKSAMGSAAQQQQELERLLTAIDAAVRQAAQNQAAAHTTPDQLVSSAQAQQIRALMAQAQSRASSLDSLSRQRYENRVAELSGMAASAGIDWTPPSY